MKIEYTMVDFHGRTSASSFPTLTPSMRIALKDLRLEGLVVLHPGTASYPLGDRVRVMPVAALAGGTLDTLFLPSQSGESEGGASKSHQNRAGSKRRFA